MMLLVTTLAAFLAALARIAGGGTSYAIGVLVALAVIAVCFLCFALLFLFAWSVASLWYRSDDQNRAGSPFAADELPPQILPPREPIQ